MNEQRTDGPWYPGIMLMSIPVLLLVVEILRDLFR